jgi:hypothetical protein
MSLRDEIVWDEWKNLDLDEKITKFQLALTTMHHNGEMAEYLISDPNIKNETAFLTELSSGPNVESWNKDLTKVLGKPPGSTSKPPSDWFSFAKKHLKKALKLIAKMLS